MQPELAREFGPRITAALSRGDISLAHELAGETVSLAVFDKYRQEAIDAATPQQETADGN